MSFWGKIFGTDKAIEGVINSVSNGLDALVYTDEEKAGDAAKDRSEARSMLITWMDKSQGQNVARRLLALSITFTWLLQYISSMGLNLAAVWLDDPVKLRESATIVLDGANGMSSAVMLILGFYFAAPYMGNIASAALVKFGKDNESKKDV